MLKIQFKDKRQEPVWVVEKVFSIGSAPDNHLVIDDPSVSPYHARLVSEHEGFLLQDLSGAAGTFVNGQRINQRQVGCLDTIRCGQVEIDILNPIEDDAGNGNGYWALIADASWLAGQEFPLTPRSGDSLLLGRGNQCDIVFPGTHLSREHARITLHKDHITLMDLHSANGTYLNDKRVTEEVVAVAGDRIRLDIYSFTLLGPGMPVPQSSAARRASTPVDIERASPESDAPKRWKTRPTSPGNREEQHHPTTQPVLLALVVVLVLAVLGAAAWLLFS